MNTHPYLRAFLAGIFVPTLVLPVMLVGFITLRWCWRSLCLLSGSLFFRWRLCVAVRTVERALTWRRMNAHTWRLELTARFCRSWRTDRSLCGQ